MFRLTSLKSPRNRPAGVAKPGDFLRCDSTVTISGTQKMIAIEHDYLECIHLEKNRNAFYRLIACRDLFGLKLIRTWGRIGTKERIRMQERFDNLEDLEKAYRKIIGIRRSHGYAIKRRQGSITISGGTPQEEIREK
jgi:predicted DNA-binding WGR domain protein